MTGIYSLTAYPGSDYFLDFPDAAEALRSQPYEKGQRTVAANGHHFDVYKASKDRRGWHLTGLFTGRPQ